MLVFWCTLKVNLPCAQRAVKNLSLLRIQLGRTTLTEQLYSKQAIKLLLKSVSIFQNKKMRTFLCTSVALMFFSQGLAGVYRPYDIYRPGARAMGAGATGVSNIDSIGTIGQNPSYLADISESAFAVGLDAQTRINRIQTQVSLQPQYIPVLAWGAPITENLGGGVIIQSPFQRRFPDDNFIVYTMEAAAAYPLTRRVNIGVTGGALVGLQSDRFAAWSATWSVSALYHADSFTLGMFFRPGAELSYQPFSTGALVDEKLPDFFKFGVSTHIKKVKLAFEVEHASFAGTYFRRNGVDITPNFRRGFFGNFHPRVGADFPMPWWPGLVFRTGMFTEDFFDFSGGNERQILWTLGFGGIAGSDFWGDKLRIDFSLASSFIPSFFWTESNQIEKLQVTFEFIY